MFTYTWNPKQPFINACFSWMIPNLYIQRLFGLPGIYIYVYIPKDPWK